MMDWQTFTEKLFSRTPILSASPDGPAITGLCYDSRQARPGDLFFALPGARDNGIRFISDALSRGAVAVILQDAGAPSSLPLFVPAMRVADARGAMAAAAAVFYGDPSRTLDVCGITGTNGKTTTAFMLRRILESSGTPCALLGTVRYEWAGHSLPADRTTPEAPDLQRIFAEALAAGQRAAAMEVSSQGLCARRLEGVRFAAAAFTNLTPEHLDFHRDMEHYYTAKRLLFESLASPSSAILNADDPYGRRLASEPCLASLPRIRYSADPAATPATAEVRATAIHCTPAATDFRLHTPWGDAGIRLPLIGRYNVANALAAAAVAASRGIAPAAIATALAGMPGVPGRLERVPDPAGGRHLFVDYAHTPDALENLLRTLRELAVPPARLWCVFGCGGDRDSTKRPVMGRIAASLADAVVLTSDNPRNESPDAILREIRSGMASRPPALVEPDRPSAIRAALRLARPGDIVVVAGKGHETYQEGPNGRRSPMDDRALLRDAL